MSRARMCTRATLATLGILLGAALLASPALAAYVPALPPTCCSTPSPNAIAINQASGDVYVGSAGESGEVREFEEGVRNESFTLSELPGYVYQMAVDNSTEVSDPSKGDLYVANYTDETVYQYNESGTLVGKLEGLGPCTAVAVNSEGDVYIGIYGESGEVLEYNSKLEPMNSGTPVLQETSNANALALNSAGDLYVAQNLEGKGTAEYEPEGSGFNPTPIRELTTGGVAGSIGVAVDLKTDDVFVDNEGVIEEFNKAGGHLDEFGSHGVSNAVAVNETSADVYAVDGIAEDVNVFEPEITGPSLTVAKEGGGALNAVVTSTPPKIKCGVGQMTCSSEFEENSIVTLTEEPNGGAEPNGSTFVGWSGACSGTGECKVKMSAAMEVKATFITPPSELEVSEAEAITTTSAVFTGSVNSGGEAKYYLEYGPELCPKMECGEKTAQAVAGGTTKEAVGPIALTSLKPGTIYHVWLVSKNVATGEPVHSESRVFTTPKTPAEDEEEVVAGERPARELAEALAAQSKQAEEARLQQEHAAALAAAEQKQYNEIVAVTEADKQREEAAKRAEEKEHEHFLPLTRHQKLVKALKACERDTHKSKRVSCQKQAEKRYGPVKKKKG